MKIISIVGMFLLLAAGIPLHAMYRNNEENIRNSLWKLAELESEVDRNGEKYKENIASLEVNNNTLNIYNKENNLETQRTILIQKKENEELNVQAKTPWTFSNIGKVLFGTGIAGLGMWKLWKDGKDSISATGIAATTAGTYIAQNGLASIFKKKRNYAEAKLSAFRKRKKAITFLRNFNVEQFIKEDTQNLLKDEYNKKFSVVQESIHTSVKEFFRCVSEKEAGEIS